MLAICFPQSAPLSIFLHKVNRLPQVGGAFHSTKVKRSYQVVPMFEISMASTPSRSENHTFLVNFDVQNTTTFADIQITQLTTMSGMWACTPVVEQAV